MKPGSYQDNIERALSDPKLQLAIYSATGRLAEGRRNTVAPGVLPDYQELRQHAHDIKKHTLNHLDHYLLELERNVVARGGKVIWARDGDEACNFIRGLARERGVKVVVKSKSMTTEEIHLNEHLEEDSIEAVETHLGEYILHLPGQKPVPNITPPLPKSRQGSPETFAPTI